MSQVLTPQQIETMVRDAFNTTTGASARKQALSLGAGAPSHEFDLYEANKVIGGISTSPWSNKSGTNNTGGQDRAATELLWLSLWPGGEKRVHILTDKEMAHRLLKRFSGARFPHRIEIHHFDIEAKEFSVVGTL